MSTQEQDRESGESEVADAESRDSQPEGAFVSRLEVIEDQPLQDRAAAFTQLHEELRSTLEAGDGIRSDV